ncbi:MAG TPA: hypothetical protein VNZ52_00950, partial [Candidatus Thermoplasmatota archaeon]|nr:hypothetical protein [Candidatus Thermoplasmatota archaeon]
MAHPRLLPLAFAFALATLAAAPLATAAAEEAASLREGLGAEGGRATARSETTVVPDNVLRYLALRGKADEDVRACAPLVKPGLVAH